MPPALFQVAHAFQPEPEAASAPVEAAPEPVVEEIKEPEPAAAEPEPVPTTTAEPEVEEAPVEPEIKQELVEPEPQPVEPEIKQEPVEPAPAAQEPEPVVVPEPVAEPEVAVEDVKPDVAEPEAAPAAAPTESEPTQHEPSAPAAEPEPEPLAAPQPEVPTPRKVSPVVPSADVFDLKLKPLTPAEAAATLASEQEDDLTPLRASTEASSSCVYHNAIVLATLTWRQTTQADADFRGRCIRVPRPGVPDSHDPLASDVHDVRDITTPPRRVGRPARPAARRDARYR